MNDKPQLAPGEVIVGTNGDTIKTEQKLTIYDAAEIARIRKRRSHSRATDLMGTAVEHIISILAQEGLMVDEDILADMAYVPVGAAVGLALRIEGSPAQRGSHAHQSLSKTMDAIKKYRFGVIAHWQGVIKANAHLSPTAQDAQTEARANARRDQINAARAKAEAERKAASEAFAAAHPPSAACTQASSPDEPDAA